jgi:hypothetical protein
VPGRRDFEFGRATRITAAHSQTLPWRAAFLGGAHEGSYLMTSIKRPVKE